jgi:glycosyltransferase involved in cell wall biosynthesis
MKLQSSQKPAPVVLFIVTGFPPDVSGVSLFNWERAISLAKMSSYKIVVLAPDWQNPSTNRFAAKHIPTNLVIDLYPSKPWPPYTLTHVPCFSSRSFIRKKIHFYRPKLIVYTDVERLYLFSTWQLPGIDYAKAKSIPILAEYHTDLYNFSAAYPGWQWLRGLIKLSKLSSFLYRNFNYTICASQAAAQSCHEMGILNTKIVAFLGIDISEFSPEHCHRDNLSEWLLPHEYSHTIFLYLGRLGYEKRVDLLIRAFTSLKAHLPNCSLLIAGDGPIEVVEQLQALASMTSDIHFTGFLHGIRKAKVLASCDVFCSPSPFETFGRTLVEAMASGVPVVTVESGAVAEYICNGVNGYLVTPDDLDSLMNAMRNTMLVPTLNLANQACLDSQAFSLEAGCSKLLKLYESLLENNLPT